MDQLRTSMRVLITCLGLSALLAACGGGGDSGTGGSSTGASSPTISGQPATSATVGVAYSFTPTATSPSGTTLSFSATNLPAWMSLNAQTGELSGTPGANNVGTDSGITITVSDGAQSASLPAFSVTVQQAAATTATLSWTTPTDNTDGTPLTNIAGYVVVYGQSANALSEQVMINDPSATSYTVAGLSAGTWYFAVATLNSTGQQSSPSNPVSVTL